MKLTGGQIVAKALKANGVDYVTGMPADGVWALVEALLTPGTDIPFIQVMQEQSAVHLADGYFRACGRPMAVLLPVPLGVSKALGGVAAALADSSAMLIISGGSVEYRGHPPEDTPLRITKEQMQVSAIEQLPHALRHSFDTMLSRVVPVSLEIPAAVQNATIDVSLGPATFRSSSELQRADLGFKTTASPKDRTPRWRADSLSDAAPMLAQRPLAELRLVLERDAILVVGSGSIQALIREMIPVYYPKSHLYASSVGMVGWAVPAAIGAKLAMPARQVVCAVGDGDFLQSMQEMAVCVMHSIPVVFLVFNNSGYVSLSDVQTPVVEQHRAGEFNLPDGKPYSPDFAGIARNFGLEAWRVEHASQVNPTFIKALNSKGPSLVEVITARSSHVN